MFGRWGLGDDVYAATLAPELDSSVRQVASLAHRIEADDVLVVHHTAYDREIDAALELPQRKLLVYHNVTPARFLWDWEPAVATRCALGREHLSYYVGRVDAAVTATQFNALDLQEAGFVNPMVREAMYLFDPERLAPSAAAQAPAAPGTDVLFVGRLSPNKRQDDLIRAFALYQREGRADARLHLVGGPSGTTYAHHLRSLVERTGANGVRIGSLPQPVLNDAYRAASVFVCLSEHEGFCLPLLEAFHFGVPVIARRAAAVPETVADAAVLIDDEDLPTIAELIDLCARDETLRADLARRGRERLSAYAPEATERAWREALEPLLQ